MKQFVLIAGVPGSGKTTYALKNFPNHYHLEADDWFMDSNGKYTFNSSQLANAHKYCKLAFEKALQKNLNVVVSNTFTKRWEREFYFKKAKEYGYRTLIVHMKTKYVNNHGVSEEKVQSMKNTFEPFYPYDEFPPGSVHLEITKGDY